jgi:DNA invertase Pin-like site-specific DNA recombinase
MARVRCAIYTRKSSEEGLEQEFNSLHAQREACAAYIASQKHEGWTLLPAAYDDGGLSGGTLERPALRRLLEDVVAGRVDQIVVYKIDRLTRSLADFAKLVERLDGAGASFVSVTQSFNTATSMGRLTLNVLLSFAQFEREVTAERIRDKIAASKAKGMWMGGLVPFGFASEGRMLRIREDEAAVVREIFSLYETLGSARAVHEEALRRGYRSRLRVLKSGRTVGGGPFSRGHIHQMLANPVYAGRIRHKGVAHEGLHDAIIEPAVFDGTQARLAAQAARARGRGNAAEPSPFAGKLFDGTGDRLTPSHANKRGVRHRYYVSRRLVRNSGGPDPSGWRLPARPLEQAVARILAAAFSASAFPARLVPGASAAETERVRGGLSTLASELGKEDADAVGRAASLISTVTVASESIGILLDPAAMASALSLDDGRLCEDALNIERPMRMRRRGVETRLVLEDARAEIDRTLVRNIARAQGWLDLVHAGESFDAIAAAQGRSKNRIQQMIHLAFLAPDVVEGILKGTQPLGLTSEWLKTRRLPARWDEQRRLFATL